MEIGCRAATRLYNSDERLIQKWNKRQKSYHYAEISSRLLVTISALQIIFLFFLQENDLSKALIPFIGINSLGARTMDGVESDKEAESGKNSRKSSRWHQ